jgi:hypothetical protein
MKTKIKGGTKMVKGKTNKETIEKKRRKHESRNRIREKEKTKNMK